jgi:hypothetical protein
MKDYRSNIIKYYKNTSIFDILGSPDPPGAGRIDGRMMTPRACIRGVYLAQQKRPARRALFPPNNRAAALVKAWIDQPPPSGKA